MAYYTQLGYGSRGEDVKTLQNALNSTTGNYGLATDGIYGEKTRAAVLDYQRRNSLAVDGIAGNETLGHLYSRSNTSNNTAANDAPSLQTSFTKEHQQQLDNAWAKYANREKFSYDPEADPFYQQYKKQYQNMGRLAMEDTVGRAAALSGGYNNSYAQTAGQQTYQSYLEQLNNVMPELYGMAYNRYQAEGESLYNEYLLHEQRRQQAYAEQQDNYTKLANLLTMGYSPTDADLTAAGMTRAQANALSGSYRSTSSKRTSYSYDTHGYTTEDIKKLQTAAGITADGIWGPQTQGAYEAGYTKDGTENTKAFLESLYPQKQHGAVERAAFGPYKNYVVYKIITSDLTAGEKDFLTSEIGANEAIYNDLQRRGLIQKNNPGL